MERPYLSQAGLDVLAEEVITRIKAKQDKIVEGDGISIADDGKTISAINRLTCHLDETDPETLVFELIDNK